RGPLRGLGALTPAAGPPAGGRLGGLLPAGRPGPARSLGAAAVVVTALLCAWAVWQPEMAARASDRSFELLQRNRPSEALRAAERAREVDPYSPEPLYRQAAALAAQRRYTRAYRTMERAVIEHPRDPATWLALARFELDTLDLPQRALDTLGGVVRVDPRSTRALAIGDRARAALAPAPPS
ncbi:MAG: tetratricopeptide repeat protein, partial [Actinomycetota bacterium]|nr:tetratricopeptide repeat protein [Actinomycetota bacterium]